MSNNRITIRLAELEGRDRPQRVAKDKPKPVVASAPERPRSHSGRLAEIQKQRDLLKDHPERLAELDEMESAFKTAQAAVDQSNSRKEGN